MMYRKSTCKRVCVIGAGLAGLVTIKELQDEGHTVVCYESESDIGGVFSKFGSSSRTYNSTLLTISNYFMAFSSLPPKEKERRFWTADEYLGYLEAFSNKYSLFKLIQFNSKVFGIEQRADEKWMVTVSIDGKIEEAIFDAVAVCSGIFNVPYQPNIEGVERFKGDIVHSCHYKNAEAFRDKNVLCVGLGESGADIVYEISQVARATKLVMRKPAHMVRRFPHGKSEPNDAYTTRFEHGAVSYKYADNVVRKFKYGMVNKRLKNYAPSSNIHKIMVQWLYMTSEYGGQFFVKNDVFLQNIVDEKIDLNLFGVERIDEKNVYCKDGEVFEADAIVFTTGYSSSYDIVKNNAHIKSIQNNPRKLFKHMIHPKIGESLAFIGFLRPGPGGVPMCAELQARFLARLLSGKATLPKSLEKVVAFDEQRERNFYFLHTDKPTLINLFEFTKDLAKLIGCTPKLTLLLSDPVLAYKCYFGSAVPFQFRLSGPNHHTKEARDIIKRLPVALPFQDVLRKILANIFARTFYIVNQITFGLWGKSVMKKSNLHSAMELFFMRKISKEVSVSEMCENNVEWKNLKYFICKHTGIDPKKLSPNLSINEITAMTD